MLSAAITYLRLEIFLAKSMSVFEEMWNRSSLFTEMSHLVLQNQSPVQETHKTQFTEFGIYTVFG